MFIKVTKSGPRKYVQVVESFRDEAGRVRQRTIASLGRLEKLSSNLDSLVRGLHRVAGEEPRDERKTDSSTPELDLKFLPARALGHVWSLSKLWHELGFDRLSRVFRNSRHEIEIEALFRIMVFNRLCDPESKLGVLRWLETVSIPDLPRSIDAVSHQHLLRAMDALIQHHDEVEELLSTLLRPLIDDELMVAFYDMTTIRATGLSEQEEDVRRFGKAKSGLIERQFMLGVVQTAEGLPIYHEVFEGNTSEVKTLKPTLEKLLQRYPINRLIVVADRGLLSLDNLREMQAIHLPNGAPLEFILAVPGRRYRDFISIIQPWHSAYAIAANEEQFGELCWDGLRLVVAHNPDTAVEQTQARDKKIADLEQQASQWVGKLDGQDVGKKSRGRKLSDGGARARFYRAVHEEKLGSIIKVDLHSELFTYRIDENARSLANLMDGKLLLVTNTPKEEFDSRTIVERYKSLSDIERGFRALKSTIEIGPVHHRLPDRIRAHALICFTALVLLRVMRQRLKAVGSHYSPERSLEQLCRLQHHRVEANQQSLSGIGVISDEQQAVMDALQVPKPRKNTQLTLL